MVARTRLNVTLYVHYLACYWLVTLIVPKQSADPVGHDVVQDSFLFTDGPGEFLPLPSTRLVVLSQYGAK